MRKAIIIDDEPNSRELLSFLLQQYFPGISLLGFATSAKEGISQIKKLQPDLVFLDIELSGGNGFQVIDAFENPSFEVVFTSGYHPKIARNLQYASLPYLTKPIILEELKDLALALPELPVQPDQVKMAQSYQKGSEKDSLFISSRNAYHKIAFRDIAFIEAKRAYARIVLVDGGEHFSAHPLGYFEDLLPLASFFRIHRSFLINVSLIASYDPGRTGFVHLVQGHALPIAARRKAGFVQFIKDQNH